MKIPIVMFLTIISLAGCDEVKNDPIDCNLYVRYEADEKIVTSEAEFSEIQADGKIISYHPKGGVSFLGSNMASQDLPGGKKRYTFEHHGSLPTSLPFAWNPPNGPKTIVEVEGIGLQGFEFIQQPENYLLLLKGVSLAENETLVLLFTDEKNTKINKEFRGPAKGNSLMIPKKELSSLVSGQATLSLVITRNSKVQKPDCDCTVSFAHYSIKKEFDI